ncbi:helix-turn-helix domain-containing protein [Rhodococcus sp. I2R]|jgi:excisionase family DNA binding protein|uniref:helix-turn-helix domain-containing protein n=1 Tax=Rhodococcus sp. I2R TaxID=2855445 RepID=UPI001E5EB62A|nr:helix-turn-helix domain-containing protein [Rhodococcus sp. I2R]MCC8927137.1 helix-turn-helix domain-containing protein [Rhodococcus sp. I2R]
MTVDPKELLTIEEFAAAVGMSPRTVRGWITQGKIEVYKIGGWLTKIHPDQIDRIVQKQA